MTPFEMAMSLKRAGWDVPSYPVPLHDLASDNSAARLLDAAYLHLCDAWEWQVRALYQAYLGSFP